MTGSADARLAAAQRQFDEAGGENRLIRLIESGQAPLSAIGALAAEQHRVITSDWRAFLTLAARAEEPNARQFFSGLAAGEAVALERVAVLARHCGLDADAVRAYKTQPGCQSYPSYVASLALNGDPLDVLVTLVAGFGGWGGYCASASRGLREHYGFDDEGCGFFDLFADPDPSGAQFATAAVAAGIASGWTGEAVDDQIRLLQHYEHQFWNTLADLAD
ncbi:hypothetical protein GCM10022247_39190 [Allokutzneria multivorans]|uniref:Transcriptional regulator n=1 Tax=Allokutzneria multivorans TaxID=1142134 RepID=A0ABP7SJW0_9PSEU